LIEAEVAAVIGAAPHERRPERLAQRTRVLSTTAGDSEVSRICADLDAEVGAFWDRSLAGQSFP
jgi:putative transposase